MFSLAAVCLAACGFYNVETVLHLISDELIREGVQKHRAGIEAADRAGRYIRKINGHLKVWEGWGAAVSDVMLSHEFIRKAWKGLERIDFIGLARLPDSSEYDDMGEPTLPFVSVFDVTLERGELGDWLDPSPRKRFSSSLMRVVSCRNRMKFYDNKQASRTT
eukprot:gene4014-biopygen1517